MNLTHYVYQCFDSQGRLLYVGLTMDPTRRLKQHRCSSAWWCEDMTVRIEGPFPVDYARELERWRIRYGRPAPIHNKLRVPPTCAFDRLFRTAVAS